MTEGSQIAHVHDPVEAFLAERAESKDEKPLFLFVHVCAPHHPYDPPPPFDTRFSPRDNGNTERKRALYDGEIAYSDTELGELLDRMRALGIFDESVVVLLSDHGEEFEEHGGWLHGRTLFEESLRVPLILRLPKGAEGGRRVEARAGLADVLPTVLSVLGIAPIEGLDGVDLTTAWHGEPTGQQRPMFFELDLRRDRLDALIVGDLKLVDRESPESSVTLYRLSEQEPDRAVDDPHRTAALHAQLDDVRSELRAGFYVELANARDSEELHRVVGRLEVLDGTIVRIDAPRSPRHRFTVAEDRTRIDFDLELHNQPNVPPSLPPVGGRIRMRVMIDGETPRARLSYMVDGKPATRLRLLEGEERRPRVVDLPFETEIARADLDLGNSAANAGRRPDLFALPAPPPADNPVSAHVYRVPDLSAPEIELDPDMRARLRDLGYVE